MCQFAGKEEQRDGEIPCNSFPLQPTDLRFALNPFVGFNIQHVRLLGKHRKAQISGEALPQHPACLPDSAWEPLLLSPLGSSTPTGESCVFMHINFCIAFKVGEKHAKWLGLFGVFWVFLNDYALQLAFPAQFCIANWKCRLKGDSTGTKETRQERENNGLDKNHSPQQKWITRLRGMKRDPWTPAPVCGRLLWEGWGEGGKPNCERRSPVGREGAGGCRGVSLGSWRQGEPGASSHTPEDEQR